MRLAIALVGTALALTACGGSGGSATTQPAPSTGAAEASSTPPSESPSPTSDDATSIAAAKAVAQEEADRYSASDYAGAWELWTTEGKKALSKADYQKLHDACPGPGVSYDIEGVRIESPGNAVARLSVMGFKQAYDLKYESGSWRWQPLASDMKDYARGVDALIAKLKNDGSC